MAQKKGKKKKIVDKWKSKKWFEIVAPKEFENKVIGETVAGDEAAVINRIVKTNLLELGLAGEGNRRFYASTNLKFRVIEVKGKTANTKYIGHSLYPSYLKMLARKGRTVIDLVDDYETKDGEGVRLKFVAITSGNISHITKKNTRKAMREFLRDAVPKMSFEEVVNETLHGKLTSKVYNRLKEVTSMYRVEVRKLERKESFEN